MELLASFLWILLLPLAVVQLIVAMRMRSHLDRGWGGTTALVALVSIVIGAGLGMFGENHHGMGRTISILGFLPSLPVAAALAHRRLWPMAVATLIPAVVASLLLVGAESW